MARPREFDREEVLAEAIKVFADHGFGGTSTDALLKAMGISRQSMYDTFGDKRRLYLEALQRYSAGSVSEIIRSLNTGPSPLKGLEAALERVIAEGKASGEVGSNVDIRTAAQFIGVTLSGMKVAARGGVSAST